jgi:hypothetical protein
MGIDPLAREAAELGFLRGVIEIHGEPLQLNSLLGPHGEEAPLRRLEP